MPDSPDRVIYFAETDHRDKRVRFGIKEKDRTRHMYVIGKTGGGKSTLLENLAVQDIQNGSGLAFIDPHGGSAEALLDYVPKERIKDVLYFAPFDMEHPVSFNIMEDVGADKRHLVVSGLMNTFEKIWADAWSARMAYILQNTILALLEFPGATLLGVNRMLTDKYYRELVVGNVKDLAVRSFWVDEFAKYTDKYAAEATPAIQNKVGQFSSNPLIRNIIGQAHSSFDLRTMMDEEKIIIVNLSKGRVGDGNVKLLGGMMVTKMYLAAMSRADMQRSELDKLPSFNLYVDEFQSFANKSFADILSEARKYKLALTIANQYIEQMEEEVRDAVFGNVGTTVSFRAGPLDAEMMEKVFAPKFTGEDVVNLGRHQIYLSLMIDGMGSSPFSARTLPPVPLPAVSYKEEILENSRKMFGTPRAEVEAEIRAWHESSGAPINFVPGAGAAAAAAARVPTPVPASRPAAAPVSSPRPANASAPVNQASVAAAPVSIGGFAPKPPVTEGTPGSSSTSGAAKRRKRKMNEMGGAGAPHAPVSASRPPFAQPRPMMPNVPPETMRNDLGSSNLKDLLASVMSHKDEPEESTESEEEESIFKPEPEAHAESEQEETPTQISTEELKDIFFGKEV